MLEIVVPATELYDEKNNKFLYIKEQTLRLEHSLVSLSKWESKYKKPFLTDIEKTSEETLDYIKYMTITKNVDPLIYLALTEDNSKQIHDYISDPMTATTFNISKKGKSNSEQTTSELIYYWMICYQIPFECQKWHLNRLLTLIEICNLKNSPQKKMSKDEIYKRNRELNEIRKKKWHSKG